MKDSIVKKGIRYLSAKQIFNFMSDERYLKMKYWACLGKKLNLKDPKTFSEKIQWLKLYDRNPMYTNIVDKHEVKKYVSNKIGNEYIIKTLGVYEKFSEIDFEILPKQFVIKCTHNSGGIIVCKDKDKLNIEEAEKKMNKSMKNNYYYWGREWPYKNIKPRIIIEEYLEDKEDKELRDYKFYCFNGAPELLLIVTERNSGNPKMDYFDMNFNRLKLRQNAENSTIEIRKPKNFEKMKKLASILSKDFIHIRVDFYEADGKIFFGELTFYDGSGLEEFQPEEWDEKLGDMIKLPIK